jgi:hypothetical protein
MESITGVDLAPAAGATNQSRREALKMFGRYAAAAPVAMVLLQPSESLAGKGKGRGKSRGKRKGKRKGWHY